MIKKGKTHDIYLEEIIHTITYIYIYPYHNSAYK